MDFRSSKKKTIVQGIMYRGRIFSFVALALFLFAIVGCSQSQDIVGPAENEPTETDVSDTTGEEGTPTVDDTGTPTATKTFTLTGKNFVFLMDGKENPELRVQEGDTVKIELSVAEGFHDWVVDDFNAKTQQVKAGSTTTVTFVADKKGTFEYYCSVGSHQQQGMKGTLIVE